MYYTVYSGFVNGFQIDDMYSLEGGLTFFLTWDITGYIPSLYSRVQPVWAGIQGQIYLRRQIRQREVKI